MLYVVRDGMFARDFTLTRSKQAINKMLWLNAMHNTPARISKGRLISTNPGPGLFMAGEKIRS